MGLTCNNTDDFSLGRWSGDPYSKQTEEEDKHTF